MKGLNFLLGVCLFVTVPVDAWANRHVNLDTLKKERAGAFRIILDPGHGGRDSATRAGRVFEKDVVLAIAREIRSRLEDNGFEVVMTRERDEFVSLRERALVTGDVFISLHANTVADTIGESVRSMIKGMEVYYSKDMEDRPEILRRSRALATIFGSKLSEIHGINMRGVKEKSLAVLSYNRAPAILIELGFLSNPNDLAFLTNRNNYQYIAEAFIGAIKVFRQHHKLPLLQQ